MSSEKVTKLIDDVKTLTVLELADLVKALEEEFGVSASAPVAVAAAGPVAGAGDAGVAAQTEFDVILKSAGQEKIKVIRLVREVTGLGLKEAKGLVDGAPKPVKEKISEDEAKTLEGKFKEVGATVEVK